MESGKLDLSTVSSIYGDSFAKYGETAKGMGWGTKSKHDLRFEKIAYLLAGRENITLNDLGCGYGALYDYLKNAGVTVRRYSGYEINPEILAAAKKRISCDEVILKNLSYLDSVAQFSVASGIFNVCGSNDKGQWKEHVLSTLKNMNQFSSDGFAFNMLTSYVDWEDDGLYYANPLEFFDFCKREFSGKVALLHDTPLWEWTICVFKSPE